MPGSRNRQQSSFSNQKTPPLSRRGFPFSAGLALRIRLTAALLATLTRFRRALLVLTALLAALLTTLLAALVLLVLVILTHNGTPVLGMRLGSLSPTLNSEHG
jgi:hypothetical protein